MYILIIDANLSGDGEWCTDIILATIIFLSYVYIN